VPHNGNDGNDGDDGDDGDDGAPAMRLPLDPATIARLNRQPFTLTPALIHRLMLNLAPDYGWEAVAGRLTPAVVGHVLGRLGLERQRTARARGYLITLPALARLLQIYRIALPRLPDEYHAISTSARRAAALAGSLLGLIDRQHPNAPSELPSPP
jgi:hypothetical protein